MKVFKFKSRKAIEVENSKLTIAFKDTQISEQGEIIPIIRWKLTEQEISLGSLKKPNEDIKFYRYDVPSDNPSNLFGNVFGGLK